MSSAVLYLFIFSITGVLSEYSTHLKDDLIEEKVKKALFMIFTISIPATFAGIRFGIGTDYNNYSNIFDAIMTGSGYNPTETGYTWFNYMVGSLGGNIQHVFFLMSFLTILFVYLFLANYKDSISVGVGMLVFMILFYNMSFNIVRQVFAIAISLYAMQFIDQKKLKKFIFFILLAFTFHASAVIMLPLYYVHNIFSGKRKLFRVIVYLVFFLALANYQVIVEFVSLQLLNTEKYLYLTRIEGANLTLGAVLQHLPQILVGILFYDDLMRGNKSFKFYFFILIIGYLTGLLPALGAPVVLKRIGSFFTVTNTWLIPYYYEYFKEKENYWWIVPTLIMYMIILWFVMYVISGDAETIPYNTIFSV